MTFSNFQCGCCGVLFRSTDEEQRKFDQDEGYGICDGCAREIEEQNEREWKKMEDFVAASLNETNRAKFLAYDQDLRRGIMLQMIDDGVLKFVIKRAMPSE